MEFTRKVRAQKNSFVITLPIEIARGYDLHHGDLITLDFKHNHRDKIKDV